MYYVVKYMWNVIVLKDRLIVFAFRRGDIISSYPR